MNSTEVNSGTFCENQVDSWVLCTSVSTFLNPLILLMIIPSVYLSRINS